MSVLKYAYDTLIPSYQNLLFSIRNMSTPSTSTYIKKLVRIVYQKQKQITQLKRSLRDHPHPSIQQQIQLDLMNTSQQLRQVSLKMEQMGEKMVELENYLEEEINKNWALEVKIEAMSIQKEQGFTTHNSKEITTFDQQQQTQQIFEQKRISKAKQMELYQRINHLERQFLEAEVEKESMEKQVEGCLRVQQKLREEISGLEVGGLQTIKEMGQEIDKLKNKCKDYQNQVEELQKVDKKVKEQNIFLQEKQQQIDHLKNLSNDLTTRMNTKNSQISSLQTQIFNLQTQFCQKNSQFAVLNQLLKDYQQFSLQITVCIQALHIKHLPTPVRSSKKLIKQSDRAHRFQTCFKKLSQVGLYIQQAVQKLQRMGQNLQLPSQTLQGLSAIDSFQDKLEYIDLTEHLDQERQQLQRNQQQLLKKLQKDCGKSFERDRSRAVELGQVREVLKMTKEVNRQLMEEINQKEFLLRECKKVLGEAKGDLNGLKGLKKLLGIKN